MREHEVPTHVQAEDKVLLWFSFPQIVAVTAVCALSYGAYSYAPVGPIGARIGLAFVLGVLGIAMIVGKVGGRSLPHSPSRTSMSTWRSAVCSTPYGCRATKCCNGRSLLC